LPFGPFSLNGPVAEVARLPETVLDYKADLTADYTFTAADADV
jgi:hypothetical protein